MRDDNKTKKNYEQRQKDKGLIKTCLWISPDDFTAIQRKAELSRERHEKKSWLKLNK